MYKIGVIGDYDSVRGYSVIGFYTEYASTREEAKEILLRMLKENYAVIYMTEEFFFEVNSDFCVVLPLPESGTGLGESRIEGFIEKAVGSKI